MLNALESSRMKSGSAFFFLQTLIFLEMGLSLAAIFATISERYVLLSKAWYDGNFGGQVGLVGQEDV